MQLVEDHEKPDGILSTMQFQETSPKLPGTHRPFGRLKRLPDKEVPVRIQRTGEIILEEATLEATNEVVDQWVRSNDFKLK